jgi:small subunit ribosomal protein S20
MANIKSAAKRAEIAERNRQHNKAYKSAIRTLIKSYMEALARYKAQPSPEAMNLLNERMSLAFSKIDRAVKRGVIHRNTGARRKSRLALALAKVVTPTEQVTSA